MDLEYEIIGQIDSEIEAKIHEVIESSGLYEVADELPNGRLNHIVIKGTKIPVGYIGRENLEKVNPNDKKLKLHHKWLEGVYQGTIDSNSE